MENNSCVRLKILIIGRSNVGKSSVLEAFTTGEWRITNATIGQDYRLKKIRVKGENVHLGIWDTAGMDRFKTVTPLFYRDANGVICVYDVSEPLSLSSLTDWIKEMEFYSTKPFVGVVLGNKIDKNRAVTREEGEKFAKLHRMMFMESSAKTLQGINEVFEELTIKILEKPGAWKYDTVEVKKNINLTETEPETTSYCCTRFHHS